LFRSEIDPTLNLAEQRNISLNNIETEFFMFIDAGDILPSYTTGFYLEQIKKNDIVFSSVFTKTYNIPQLIDINKLKVNKNVLEDNNITVNKYRNSTNVLFKTSIINNNNIKFNTTIGPYAEWAFIIDALITSNTKIYFYNFPLYYRDEHHDSLNILKYAENDFDDEFKAYVKNFIRYI